MLFVIREDNDTTTCAFLWGCCKVSGTAVKAVSGGLPHSGKYDFLNIEFFLEKILKKDNHLSTLTFVICRHPVT
jgi:hypothetical protein